MKSDIEDDEIVEIDDTKLDEELDAAAQGDTSTSDGGPSNQDEIDAMGEAAGLPDDPEKPFRGIDKVDRRDEKRWELDPSSKDVETGIS